MTNLLKEARGELATRISVQKALSAYVHNTFTVEETYYPYERLETMSTDFPGGKLYVIGLAIRQGVTQSRTNLTLVEVPVQVGFQIMLPGQTYLALSTIDTYAQLVEELQNTARKLFDLDGFTWNRNEPLTDENGTPYSYIGYREAALFEAYFTAYYQTPQA